MSVYLDNAATTPVDPRVKEAMLPYLEKDFGNASSVHAKGRDAKVLLEDARESVAALIGARPSEIFFTSGGTESNNFAIKGVAFKNFGEKDHVITSAIEHSSVRDTLNYLQQRFKFRVTTLSNDSTGKVNIRELNENITDKTCLIAIMHSNNEIGTVQDIKAGCETTKKFPFRGRGDKVHFHTDSVQSIGKTEFNVNDIGCDSAVISSHKIYGPKGIGALYLRRGVQIDKFVHGGEQERNLRGGTENIPAIAGFMKAVEILKDEKEKDIAHYKALKEKLISLLENNFKGYYQINCSPENSLPNIINISFTHPSIEKAPEGLLIRLDMDKIEVSAGSACTSGSVQPSHVLTALGLDELMVKSSARISFGRFNTEDEIEKFIAVLKKIIK